ncbi:MAG: hypothetical protein U0797_22170 [Gemmataceae bacterium]
MKKIVAAAEPFERFERPTAEARGLVEDLSQSYKVEHIDEELSRFPSLSFYRQGEFIDLCRGPHIPHAGKIGAFKLLSIAGAYWKNDNSRKQLQRLYGTAFFTQKELDAYLQQVEEAKRRDHRVLGKQLKLFTISQSVGSGLILWMPKGLDRAAPAGVVHPRGGDQAWLLAGVHPAHRPTGVVPHQRPLPYYRDAQFPPMYFNAVAGVIDTGPVPPRRRRQDEEGETSSWRRATVLQACRSTARPARSTKKLAAVEAVARHRRRRHRDPGVPRGEDTSPTGPPR